MIATPRPRRPAPRLRLATAGLALAAVGAWAWPAAAAPGQPLLYVSQPAASAIAEGAPGVPGAPDALRQGPVRPEEWPRDLVLAKVSGAELSRLDADGMAGLLRSALAGSPAGVGVDELVPRDWTAGPATALATALRQLGPGPASRVVLYVGPGLVSRVGTTDPSRPLAPDLAATVRALRLAGAVVLELYRAGGAPRTPAEYAAYPTRWLPRFPGAGASRLRLMLGPAGGLGQPALWDAVRSTPAGRRLLANGPAAYGLRTRGEGQDWVAAYAAFRADPGSPPAGGDVVVPALGGLSLAQAGPRALRLSATLTARIVIQLLPAGGGARRVIGPFAGPVRDLRVTVPPRLPAGRYTAVAVADGEGMREEARAQVTLGAPTR